jgi:hypothetical protein
MKPIFARHETFHPRYGWLKKGFDAVVENPMAFTTSDAHVRLGVGKNMVRSIRYWCHAFKLLQEKENGRGTASLPTLFGEFLLGEKGVDPYLEELASLWLLHWRLISGASAATAWQYAFFYYTDHSLSIDTLAEGLRGFVAAHFPSFKFAESSFRKDAACLLRMYGDLPPGNSASDESIHCPFAELGLLRPSAGARAYEFRLDQKPGLANEIVVAACLEFAANSGDGARTISLQRLLHSPGGPGLAFKLTEDALYSAVESIAESEKRIGLSDTAGIIHLSFSIEPQQLAQQLIRAHYLESTVALRERGYAMESAND